MVYKVEDVDKLICFRNCETVLKSKTKLTWPNLPFSRSDLCFKSFVKVTVLEHLMQLMSHSDLQ